MKNNAIDIPLAGSGRRAAGLAKRVPQMDMTRVGVFGWSFGGYFSAMATIRRPDVFAAGVAGAPVTDWQDYDTYLHRTLYGPAADERGRIRQEQRADLCGQSAAAAAPRARRDGRQRPFPEHDAADGGASESRQALRAYCCCPARTCWPTNSSAPAKPNGRWTSSRSIWGRRSSSSGTAGVAAAIPAVPARCLPEANLPRLGTRSPNFRSG